MSDEEKRTPDPAAEKLRIKELAELRNHIQELKEKLSVLENRIVIEQKDLTHESKYIQDRTNDVMAAISSLRASLAHQVASTQLWMFGDNTEENKGVNIRLISLEEKEKTRKKFWDNFLWIVIASLSVGAFIAILGLVFDVFKPEITHLMKHWYTGRPAHTTRGTRPKS